jgi:hypothetical protein
MWPGSKQMRVALWRRTRAQRGARWSLGTCGRSAPVVPRHAQRGAGFVAQLLRGLIRAPEAPSGVWRSRRARRARCRAGGFAPGALHEWWQRGAANDGTDSGNLTRRGDPCERALTPHTSATAWSRKLPARVCLETRMGSRRHSRQLPVSCGAPWRWMARRKKVTPSLYWPKSYHLGEIELERGVGRDGGT